MKYKKSSKGRKLFRSLNALFLVVLLLLVSTGGKVFAENSDSVEIQNEDNQNTESISEVSPAPMTNPLGYGVITAQTYVLDSATGTNKYFSNSLHNATSAFTVKPVDTNMHVQLSFPSGATQRQVKISLPVGLTWVDHGGGSAISSNFVTSVTGPENVGQITKPGPFSMSAENGTYTYNVSEDTTAFGLTGIIKAQSNIVSQTITDPIIIEVYYNGVLQDTVYSGDVTIDHPSTPQLLIDPSTVQRRAYVGVGSDISIGNQWNYFSLMSRDSSSQAMIVEEISLTLRPDSFVDASGLPIAGTGDLTKIIISNLDTEHWTATAPAADGSVTFTSKDFNSDYLTAFANFSFPLTSGLTADQIIKVAAEDIKVTYYNDTVIYATDSAFYFNLVPQEEDVYVDFNYMYDSDQVRPELMTNYASYKDSQLTYEAKFGNREDTTGMLGGFSFGNRGGSNSLPKEVIYNFDSTDISVQAFRIGLPYRATSLSDPTNIAPILNGGLITAEAVDRDGNSLGTKTYTLPAQYLNITKEEVPIISYDDFGFPEGASITKVSYQLQTIPQGDVIPGAGNSTPSSVGDSLQYFGSIKNLNATTSSTIQVKDITGSEHDTGASEYFTKTSAQEGALGIRPFQTVVFDAGTSATVSFLVIANAMGEGNTLGSVQNGVTTNPIVYIRNDMVSSDGLIDVNSIVINDIYGNPLVKDTDYTVTEVTVGGVQTIKIDTVGVTDNRASVMSTWVFGDPDNPAAVKPSSLQVSYTYSAGYLASADTQSFSTSYFVEDPNADSMALMQEYQSVLDDPYNLGSTPNVVATTNANQLAIRAISDLQVSTEGKLSTEGSYRDPYDGSNAITLTPSQKMDYRVNFINTSGAGGAIKKARVYVPIPKIGDNWGAMLGSTSEFDMSIEEPFVNPDASKYEILYGTVVPSDNGSTLDSYYSNDDFAPWNASLANEYNCVMIRVLDGQEVPYIDLGTGATSEEIIVANTTSFTASLVLSTENTPNTVTTSIDSWNPGVFREVLTGTAQGSQTFERYGYGKPVGVNISSVVVNLDAVKTLGGSKINTDITAGQFSFTLALTSGTVANVDGLPITAVTCGAGTATGATVNFDDIRIFDVGTYEFSITESIGSVNGYTYDENPVTARVVVTADPSTGALSYTMTLVKDGENVSTIEFINTYAAESTTYTIPAVEKIFSSTSDPRSTNKSFEFEIDGVLGTEPLPSDPTVNITGSGSTTFGNITYTAVGVYEYVITETVGDEPGYSYSNMVYDLTVTVTDVNGLLSAVGKITKNGTAVDEIVFENTYTTTDVTWTSPNITKIISGDMSTTDEVFTFLITGKNNTEPLPSETSKTITGIGQTSFGDITYTQAGVYEYTITELAGSSDGWTYDPIVYTLTITVEDVDAQLIVTSEITVEGEPTDTIVFENKYTNEEIPVVEEPNKENPDTSVETGDFSNLTSWTTLFVMAIGTLSYMVFVNRRNIKKS